MKQLFPLLAIFFSMYIQAQPAEPMVRVVVTPDRSSWEYKPGEKATFSITVYKDQVPLEGAKVIWQTAPERFTPFRIDSFVSGKTPYVLDGGALKQPGFLRCVATAEWKGKKYKGLATVGYAVTSIQPTVTMPADFQSFWEKGKAELASMPLDLKLMPMPERSSASTNVYQINAQGYGGSRLYGILCVPKKTGKYPALLQVPGAGIRPYGPDLAMADKGIIVLTIGIHGIPVNLDPAVYENLNAGALKGYPFFNLEDKDRYYYKRVYLNCVRANDILTSLEQYDGERLMVTGGSQGGALSIVTAALDKRVKGLAALYPALSDLTGYLQGRAGGWPHVFAESNRWISDKPEVKATLPYYDVVNFARNTTVSGYYTWGFNDETCPPTSMYAAYNAITAPRQLVLYRETGHWTYPEQTEALRNWIVERFESMKR